MPVTPDAGPRPSDGVPAVEPPELGAENQRRPRFLYLQAALVALLGSLFILVWFLAYNWLNKMIWDNTFVTANRWMFPVVCLPFSLLVGLLVKYTHAPTNLESSVVDTLTGDPSKTQLEDTSGHCRAVARIAALRCGVGP